MSLRKATGLTLRPTVQLEIVAGILVLAALALTSLASYLVFHTLAELSSIVVAWSIALLAWNTRRFLDNGYLLLISVALLFIGIVDLFHTLTFKGMGVFPSDDANVPTQLWIAARYLQSFSFLIAPFFLGRKLDLRPVVAGYAVATGLLLGSIFTGVFPACYVEGQGLTAFKVVSEWIISLFLLGGLAFLWQRRNQLDAWVLRLLAFSLIASIASELIFTTYLTVSDWLNLTGHLFKLIGVYFLYKAVVETGLVRPFTLIFRELKAHEEALQSARDELEIRVEERTAELSEANRQITQLNADLEERVRQRTAELEAANRELEAFSYSVAHDLRGPLTGLEGFVGLLAERYGDSLDERGTHYLDRIRESGARMQMLTNDLLDLSRASRAEVAHERVDLTALARELADELNGRDAARRIEWQIADGLTATGDPTLLRVVLENLLGNAVKFTSRCAVAHISLSRETADGQAAFAVRDDGAGFDMADRERLFKPFQRLHSAHDYPGTGIGLATVHRIITRHGGRVWAEGKPGSGAVFYFVLPD